MRTSPFSPRQGCCRLVNTDVCPISLTQYAQNTLPPARPPSLPPSRPTGLSRPPASTPMHAVLFSFDRETAAQGAQGEAEAVDPTAAAHAPLLGPVPLVAIPIIAGVGSEVTPMATILDDKDPLEPEKVCTEYLSVRLFGGVEIVEAEARCGRSGASICTYVHTPRRLCAR